MYLLLLAVIGGASAVLAVVAWPHRKSRGFVHFVVLEAATSWWLLCYLGEQLDGPRAAWWFAAKFPAISLIPPSWLLFTLHHIGKPPRSRAWLALYIWPVLVATLMFTNDWHRLVFTEIVRRQELGGVNGPLFAVHLAINYACTAVAVSLLVLDGITKRKAQSGILALASLLPLGANMLNELGKAGILIGTSVPTNPTLPGFGLSALFIGYTILRYRMFDPRPMARDILFESMADLVLVLNERGVIVDANRAAVQTLAAAERRLVGRAWSEVVAGAEGWHDLPATHDRIERLWRRLEPHRWFEIERRPLRDTRDRAIGVLVVLRDITSRKQLEEELRRESYSDRLTGLSNRRHFDYECARLKASRDFPVAVFMFDLDGLKEVNDTLGHDAGDRLLRTMAVFLRQFFRGGDRIFRIGGDEFATLLPATRAAEAQAIAQRMAAGLHIFNRTNATPLRFSSGWAIAAEPGEFEAALKEADAGLYRHKRANAPT